MKAHGLLALVIAGLAWTASACGSGDGADTSKDIRLDYAYYNPLSLVIRDQKLLENKGYNVTWVQSAGSNKANEALRADALDLGSTAGAAALVARANGTPIKVVDIYSKPEWAALVVAEDAPITGVADLRGKKIAVTKGTDPYYFLLQSLKAAGLSRGDVEIVNLQHADGKTALERGDVDAWSGLDPFIAQTVQQSRSRLLYRNPDFNSYGTLNAREDFISGNPEAVQSVVDAYEEARAWAIAHPNELTELLAREAKISPSVAGEVLDRTDLQVDPTPGQAQLEVLKIILPVAVGDGDIKSEEAGQQALETLIDPTFAQQSAS